MKVPLEVRRKVNALRREIDEHNRRYYVLSAPTITDARYDELFAELQRLEDLYPTLRNPNSPTQKVGGGYLGGLPTVKLRVPMLSIPTYFKEEEIEAFDLRVKQQLRKDVIDYVAELKFDGVAVNLTYEKGRLTQAALRGTGTEGEQVTARVMQVSGIPLELSQGSAKKANLFEVRGEVVMKRSDFDALNKSLAANGKKLIVNPRNAASGALRQFRIREGDRKPLAFFAYGVGAMSGIQRPSRQSEIWGLLISHGFGISSKHCKANRLSGLFEFYKHVETLRDSIDFDIDGVVYKVDQIEDQERLGSVGKDVKWAVAHKFKAETKRTKLLAVEFQVGRTGVLTPVAKFDPVFVGQAMLSNATLHNVRQIQEKQIHIGDSIFVRRAGDVIPEIVGVASEGDPRIPIQIPERCPICKSRVEKNAENTAAWCTGGLICSAQVKQRLLHFCSKGAMNIEGIGEKLADVLVNEVGVKSPADIFRLPSVIGEWILRVESDVTIDEVLPASSRNSPLLRRIQEGGDSAFPPNVSHIVCNLRLGARSGLNEDAEILLLATLPKSRDANTNGPRRRLGEKDALNLLAQIRRARKVPFDRFLFALGILGVGAEIASRLAAIGMTWQTMAQTDWNAELAKKVEVQKENIKRRKKGGELLPERLPGMGPEIIGNIGNFFAEPHNLQVAREMFDLGLTLEYPSKAASAGPFFGKTFLFTGTLTQPRAEAEEKVKELGGRILGGVSKNLDYLVVGEKPGSKLTQANNLKVRVISEADFDSMLEDAAFRAD